MAGQGDVVGVDNMGNPIRRSGKTPKPDRQYSASELLPNYRGASMQAVQALLNKPITSEYGYTLSPAEQASIQGTAAKSSAGTAGASGVGGAGSVSYKNMLNALKKLSEMSAGTINAGANSLNALLAQQVNPYAGMHVANTPVAPDLAGLLQSQGIDTTPLGQFAAALNTQNTAQADAYQNLINQMSSMYEANRLGQQQDVQANRNDLLNALQGNILGTGAALMGKKNVDRNAITNMLLAAMKNRAG
mgnify:CR=1 FL=1